MMDRRAEYAGSQQSDRRPRDEHGPKLDARFETFTVDVFSQVSQSNSRCSPVSELNVAPDRQLKITHTESVISVSQPFGMATEPLNGGPKPRENSYVCDHWRYTEYGFKRRRTFSYPPTSRPFRLYPLPKSEHVKAVCARCETKRPRTRGTNFGDISLAVTSHSNTVVSGLMDWVKKPGSRPASSIAQIVSFVEEQATELVSDNDVVVPRNALRDIVNKKRPYGSLCSPVPDLSSQLDSSIDLRTEYNDTSRSTTSTDAETSNTFRTAVQASELKLLETNTTYYTPREQVRSAPWPSELQSNQTPVNYGLSPINLTTGLTPSTNSVFSLTGTGTYHTPIDIDSSGGTLTCKRKKEELDELYDYGGNRIPDDIPEQTVMGQTPPRRISSTMTTSGDLSIDAESPVSRNPQNTVTDEQLEYQLSAGSCLATEPSLQAPIDREKFEQENGEMDDSVTNVLPIETQCVKGQHSSIREINTDQELDSALAPDLGTNMVVKHTDPESTRQDLDRASAEGEAAFHGTENLHTQQNTETRTSSLRMNDREIADSDRVTKPINDQPECLMDKVDPCATVTAMEYLATADSSSMCRDTPDVPYTGGDPYGGVSMQPNDQESLAQNNPSDSVSKSVDEGNKSTDGPSDNRGYEHDGSPGRPAKDYELDETASPTQSIEVEQSLRVRLTSSPSRTTNGTVSQIQVQQDFYVFNTTLSADGELNIDSGMQLTQSTDRLITCESTSPFRWRRIKASEAGQQRASGSRRLQQALPTTPNCGTPSLVFRMSKQQEVAEREQRDIGEGCIDSPEVYDEEQATPDVDLMETVEKNALLNQPQKSEAVEELVVSDVPSEAEDTSKSISLAAILDPEKSEPGEFPIDQSVSKPDGAISQEQVIFEPQNDFGPEIPSIVFNQATSERTDHGMSYELPAASQSIISNKHSFHAESISTGVDQQPLEASEVIGMERGSEIELHSRSSNTEQAPNQAMTARGSTMINTAWETNMEATGVVHDKEIQELITPLNKMEQINEERGEVNSLQPSHQEPITSQLGLASRTSSIPDSAMVDNAASIVSTTAPEKVVGVNDLPEVEALSYEEKFKSPSTMQSEEPTKVGELLPCRLSELEPYEGSRAEAVMHGTQSGVVTLTAPEQLDHEQQPYQEETLPPTGLLAGRTSTADYTEVNTTQVYLKTDAPENIKSTYLIPEMEESSKPPDLETSKRRSAAVTDQHFKADEETTKENPHLRHEVQGAERVVITTSLRTTSGQTPTVAQENQPYVGTNPIQPNLAKNHSACSDTMTGPEETSLSFRTITSPEVVSHDVVSEMEDTSRSSVQDKLLRSNKLLFTVAADRGVAGIAEPVVCSEKDKQLVWKNTPEEQEGTSLKRIEQVTSPINRVLECTTPTQEPEYEEKMVLEKGLELGVMFDTDQVEMTAFWTTVPHPQPTTTETVDPEATQQSPEERASALSVGWNESTSQHSVTFRRTPGASASEVFTNAAVTDALEDIQLRQPKYTCGVETPVRDILLAEYKHECHIELTVSGGEPEDRSTPIQLESKQEIILNSKSHTELLSEKSVVHEIMQYKLLDGQDFGEKSSRAMEENDHPQDSVQTRERISYHERISAHSEERKQIESSLKYCHNQSPVAQEDLTHAGPSPTPEAQIRSNMASPTFGIVNSSTPLATEPLGSRANTPKLRVTITSSMKIRSELPMPDNGTALLTTETTINTLSPVMNTDIRAILNEGVTNQIDLEHGSPKEREIESVKEIDTAEGSRNEDKHPPEQVMNLTNVFAIKKDVNSQVQPGVLSSVSHDSHDLNELQSHELHYNDMTSTETVVANRIDGQRRKVQINELTDRNSKGKEHDITDMDGTTCEPWPLEECVRPPTHIIQHKSANEDSFLHSVSLVPEHGSLLSLRSETESEDGSIRLSPADGFDSHFIVHWTNEKGQGVEQAFTQPTSSHYHEERGEKIQNIPEEPLYESVKSTEMAISSTEPGIEFRSQMSENIKAPIERDSLSEMIEQNLTDANVVLEKDSIKAIDSLRPIAFSEINTDRSEQTRQAPIQLADSPIILSTQYEKPDEKSLQPPPSYSEVGSLEQLELIPPHKLSLESTASTYYTAQSSLSGLNRLGITSMESDSILPELDQNEEVRGFLDGPRLKDDVGFNNLVSLAPQKHMTSEESLPLATPLPPSSVEVGSRKEELGRFGSARAVTSSPMATPDLAAPSVDTEHTARADELITTTSTLNDGKVGTEMEPTHNFRETPFEGYSAEIEMELNIKYARSPEAKSDNLTEIEAETQYEIQPIEVEEIGPQTEIYLQLLGTSEYVEYQPNTKADEDKHRDSENGGVIHPQSSGMTDKPTKTTEGHSHELNEFDSGNTVEFVEPTPSDLPDLANVPLQLEMEEIGASRENNLRETDQAGRLATDYMPNRAEFKPLSDTVGSISENQFARVQAVSRTHANFAASLIYRSETASPEISALDSKIIKLQQAKPEPPAAETENFFQGRKQAQPESHARFQSSNDGKIASVMSIRFTNTARLVRSTSTDGRERKHHWSPEVSVDSSSRAGSSMSLPHFTDTGDRKDPSNVPTKRAQATASPTSCTMNFRVGQGQSSAGRPSSPLEWSLASTAFVPHSNATTSSDSALPTSPTGHKLAQRSDTPNWIRPYGLRARQLVELPANHNVGRALSQREYSNSNLPSPTGKAEPEGSPTRSGTRSPRSRVSQVQITISQRVRRSRPRSREDGQTKEANAIQGDPNSGTSTSPAPSDLQRTLGGGYPRAISPTEISSNIEMDPENYTVAREITDQAIQNALSKLCSNSPTMLSSANSEAERETELIDGQPVSTGGVIKVATDGNVHVSSSVDIRDTTRSPITIALGSAPEKSLQVSPTATPVTDASSEPRTQSQLALNRPDSAFTYSMKTDVRLVTTPPPYGSSPVSAEISTQQEINIPRFSEISSTWMSNVDVVSGGKDPQCQVTATFDIQVTSRNVQTPSDLGALQNYEPKNNLLALPSGQGTPKTELMLKMDEPVELAAQDLPIGLTQHYTAGSPRIQDPAVYEDGVRTVEDPQCQLSSSFDIRTITKTSLVISSPAAPRGGVAESPIPSPLPTTSEDRQHPTVSFRTELQVFSETEPEQTLEPEAEKPAQNRDYLMGKTNAGDLSKAATSSLKKDFRLSIDRSGGIESPTSIPISTQPEGEPPAEIFAFSPAGSPQEETKGMNLTSDELSATVQNPDGPSVPIRESEGFDDQMDGIPNIVTEGIPVERPDLDDGGGAEDRQFSPSPEPTFDLPDIVSPMSGETFSYGNIEDKIQSAAAALDEQEQVVQQEVPVEEGIKSSMTREYEPIEEKAMEESPVEEVAAPCDELVCEANGSTVLHVISHTAVTTETVTLENEETGEVTKTVVPHLEVTMETYLETADGRRIQLEDNSKLIRISSEVIEADNEGVLKYRHKIITGPIEIEDKEVEIQQVIEAVMPTPEELDAIQNVDKKPIADADAQAAQSGLTINVSDLDPGEIHKPYALETIDDTQMEMAVSAPSPGTTEQAERSQPATDIGEQEITEIRQGPVEDIKLTEDTEQIEDKAATPRPTSDAARDEIEKNVSEQEIIGIPEPAEPAASPELIEASDFTSNEPAHGMEQSTEVSGTEVKIGEQKRAETPEMRRGRTTSMSSESSMRIASKRDASEERVPVNVDTTLANLSEREKIQLPEATGTGAPQATLELEVAPPLTAPDPQVNRTQEKDTPIINVSEQTHIPIAETEDAASLDLSKPSSQVEGKIISAETVNEVEASNLVGEVGQQERIQAQEYVEDMILSKNEDTFKRLASTEQIPDTLAGAETIPFTETPGEGGLPATLAEEKEENTVATKMDVDGTFEQPVQEYQMDSQANQISGPARLGEGEARPDEEVFVQSPVKQTLSETALFEDTMAPVDVDPITSDQPREQLVEQSQMETQLSSIREMDYYEQTGESKLATEGIEEKSITEITDVEKTKCADQLETEADELQLPQTKEEPIEDQSEKITELGPKSPEPSDMVVIAKQTEQPMNETIQMVEPLEIQEPPVSTQRTEGRSIVTEVISEVTVSVRQGEPPEISVKTIASGISEQAGRKYDLVTPEEPVQQQMLPSTDGQQEINEETGDVLEGMLSSIKIDSKEGSRENLKASTTLETIEMEPTNEDHGQEEGTIGMTVDADKEDVPIDTKLSPSLVAEGKVDPNHQAMIAGLREMDIRDPRSTETDQQVAQTEAQKLIETGHPTASTPMLEVKQVDQRAEESLVAEGLDEHEQIRLDQSTTEEDKCRLEIMAKSIEDLAALSNEERTLLIDDARAKLASRGEMLTDDERRELEALIDMAEKMNKMAEDEKERFADTAGVQPVDRTISPTETAELKPLSDTEQDNECVARTKLQSMIDKVRARLALAEKLVAMSDSEREDLEQGIESRLESERTSLPLDELQTLETTLQLAKQIDAMTPEEREEFLARMRAELAALLNQAGELGPESPEIIDLSARSELPVSTEIPEPSMSPLESKRTYDLAPSPATGNEDLADAWKYQTGSPEINLDEVQSKAEDGQLRFSKNAESTYHDSMLTIKADVKPVGEVPTTLGTSKDTTEPTILLSEQKAGPRRHPRGIRTQEDSDSLDRHFEAAMRAKRRPLGEGSMGIKCGTRRIAGRTINRIQRAERVVNALDALILETIQYIKQNLPPPE